MKKSGGNLTRPNTSLRVKQKDGLTEVATDMQESEESVTHTVPAAPAGSFEQKILMSSLSGIYVYDLATGGNIFINPQYTRLTGYTLEDLLRKTRGYSH